MGGSILGHGRFCKATGSFGAQDHHSAVAACLPGRALWLPPMTEKWSGSQEQTVGAGSQEREGCEACPSGHLVWGGVVGGTVNRGLRREDGALP